MEKKNPLLTIIIPAYNVEKYIEDCLNSNDNISRDLIEKTKCSINEVFKIGL